MGVITLESDEFPNLLPMLNRSYGIHVSDVIHALAVEAGHYTPSKPEQIMLELGNAFEHAIISRYRKHSPTRYKVPKELMKNGLFGHLDLFDYVERVVKEFKVTWQSVNKCVTEFWSYWCQIKAYCYMIGSNIGTLEVVFVRGDYSNNKLVAYRRWKQVFSDAELKDNWRMLCVKAKQMENEGFLETRAKVNEETEIKVRLLNLQTELNLILSDVIEEHDKFEDDALFEYFPIIVDRLTVYLQKEQKP